MIIKGDFSRSEIPLDAFSVTIGVMLEDAL
jgi:hypothetical protein